jgi:hypothetical protein
MLEVGTLHCIRHRYYESKNLGRATFLKKRFSVRSLATERIESMLIECGVIPGLPDFFRTTYQNGEKFTQKTTKYTQWP